MAAIETIKEPLASITEGLVELESAICCSNEWLEAIRESLKSLTHQSVDKGDVTAVLGHFDALWEMLYPQERIRILNLLAERVQYDTKIGRARLIFRTSRSLHDAQAMRE